MLMVSPVCATVPAMPTPNGNRISPTPFPVATRDQYSRRSGLGDLREHRAHTLGDPLEQHLVAALERPTPLVQHLQDADDGAARAIPHRNDEHVQGPVAAPKVDVAVEARIRVCVRYVD